MMRTGLEPSVTVATLPHRLLRGMDHPRQQLVRLEGGTDLQELVMLVLQGVVNIAGVEGEGRSCLVKVLLSVCLNIIWMKIYYIQY